MEKNNMIEIKDIAFDNRGQVTAMRGRFVLSPADIFDDDGLDGDDAE